MKQELIKFNNQRLLAIEKDGMFYVAMKSIFENIGLNWEGQRQRIQRDTVLNSVTCIIKVPASEHLLD